MDIDKIQNQLRLFASERDWEQFHSPKNLSMALAGEAGELIEHFQWISEDASYKLSETKLQEVSEEIADVQIYLLRLADILKVDLESAIQEKILLNAKKYPADKVRGSNKKYTEY
ncbi:nucleotide pyrophosphohydrolase [Lentisphaera profundi]|uniref:Nucleotide pyrophosphohydrolase n=1 Tax=Lentisphaera profundi TaxID=1658616 RepID=A0ABY7VPC0_9BACT|nr:nucleotide pyrophosphohydrolase [Lentisphaera profundi]WDE95822.1 nucleotide pyrophosphohydrolase [Lentisphaera profundi]